MSKAIIVYDSRFGNTEKVAQSLAKGLETGGISTDLFRASDDLVSKLQEYDALLVGCPTHAWRSSKLVKEFVPYSAVNCPVFRDFFKRGKYFFSDNIYW